MSVCIKSVSIRYAMPPLSELPDDLSRKKLLRALVRLNFVIDERGGKGSHCKAVWPRNNKVVLIKRDLDKFTLKYLLKQIEDVSGMTWSDVAQKL